MLFMEEQAKHPKAVIFDINAPYQELWEASGVKDKYLDWVDERIWHLVDNLYTYDPYETALDEYKASIQMLAYTTTELMAQFCAGGFRWISTDKARFLSPTIDLETIIRNRALNENGSIGEYFEPVKFGVWDFLEVSEYTKSWIETQKLNRQQVSYLLWSAKKALNLLKADERISGFTDLALSEPSILDGYIRCESPIESILYMQLVMDELRPPVLRNQYWIDSYRVDFAIPGVFIAIECDGKKYHDEVTDFERDRRLMAKGWRVLRFSSEKIITDPSYCSSRIYDEYPWRTINSKSEAG
jgi:very-short-patch-repair endonuclease